MHPSLGRRVAAEAIGSALLLAAITGSGIMAERLAGGNVALALLCNSAATGAALTVLILVFAPLSGAHFNPLVSMAAGLRREQRWIEVAAYVTAQIVGAAAGVFLVHLMFELPVLQASTTDRSGVGQMLAEVVATFGLLLAVFGTSTTRAAATPYAVGLYITAAYWFTSSTSFANPAVTLARTLTDTFTGIRSVDAPGFILAQAIGMLAAVVLIRWFRPQREPSPPEALPPHAP